VHVTGGSGLVHPEGKKKKQHDHVWASGAISVILSANGHSKQSFYLVGMFNADLIRTTLKGHSKIRTTP